MPVAGFLAYFSTPIKDGGLSRDLISHRALYRTQGINILRLSSGSQRRIGGGAQRNIDVGAQRTLFHAHIGYPQCLDDVAQCCHIGTRYFGGFGSRNVNRMGNYLNKWDTTAVVVNE